MDKAPKHMAHSERKPVISIKKLNKRFGDNEVLKDFDLELFENENLVIMGKSGSGKSVMIKCLVGLMEPDSGSVEVLGKDICTLKQEEMDNLRADIGFLFQGSALYDSMTVRENLEFPLRRHKERIKGDNTHDLVIEALESVGLAHTLDLLPAELSGGMQRRIALARALILKPRIIIYDEPTTGLDPITAKEIVHLIIEVQKKYNTSSLIITHDVDCARVIADRIVLLYDHTNYTEGTFEELSSSKDPNVEAFFK